MNCYLVRCIAVLAAASSVTACATVIQAPTPRARVRSAYIAKWDLNSNAYNALARARTDFDKIDVRPAMAFGSRCSHAPANASMCRAFAFDDPDGVYLHSMYASDVKFCQNIQVRAQKHFVRTGWVGGVFALVGVGATTASATWAATDDDSDHVAGKVAAIASSAIFAAAGGYLLMRAKGAAVAAGETGAALGPALGEEERWQACLEARARWIGSNADALLSIAKKTDDAKASDAKKSKNPPSSVEVALRTWVVGHCSPTAAEPVESGVKRTYNCAGAFPNSAIAAERDAAQGSVDRFGISNTPINAITFMFP